MSHLTSNLLGRCPLGRKNCPYADSYCSECITYEKTEQKRCGRMKIICTKEEIGTKALPITYEEVKEYSDNLFALLDALKEGEEE